MFCVLYNPAAPVQYPSRSTFACHACAVLLAFQEAVCDLLWSLAFNNGLVKEVVGRQGGIALILKGMSSHLSSPEVVKSACGALSNMCQNTYNQNLIAAHGGVRYEAETATTRGRGGTDVNRQTHTPHMAIVGC